MFTPSLITQKALYLIVLEYRSFVVEWLTVRKHYVLWLLL